MNITFQLAVVAVAACLCVAEGAPDGRLGRAKQQRPTRGFKNVEMMTARGFGKRDRPATRSEPSSSQERYDVAALKKFNPKSMGLLVAKDFGKRADNDGLYEDTGLMAKRIDFEPDSGYFVGRGYGKRDPFMKVDEGDDGSSRSIRTQPVTFNPDTGLLIARGPGKRDSGNTEEVYGLDNFWEMLENSPERDGQEANEEKTLESIPLDWFVSEMLNNPDFARSVVRKFVDVNQDGILSSEELLRNVV